MSGKTNTGAVVSLSFSSWKLRSQASVQTNFLSFLSSSVIGLAILENPSMNLR
ncbi:hypothetical protein PAHAL_7G071500 [Panicum hallii]|uniref:Uncharacterized protein n=1 Tax=Panicum hallii TaxID=206008 RepID=A0A2T8IB92_9POAL|nr:hypothetical protein PAHAL_7G071500 [Panicum hallii]